MVTPLKGCLIETRLYILGYRSRYIICIWIYMYMICANPISYVVHRSSEHDHFWKHFETIPFNILFERGGRKIFKVNNLTNKLFRRGLGISSLVKIYEKKWSSNIRVGAKQSSCWLLFQDFHANNVGESNCGHCRAEIHLFLSGRRFMS